MASVAQGSWLEGDTGTYQAGEDLEKWRRVQLESGSTTNPPEIVYADAGEASIGITIEAVSDGDPVSVRFFNSGGTFPAVAADTFARFATLYGADDGKVSDTSSGTAFFIAVDAATAAGDVVEIMPWPVLATTAAGVSIADAGSIIIGTTAEAALAEAFTHIKSAQHFIPLPITGFRETTNFDVGAITANGGVLSSDTTPILEAINAATDGCQRVNWVASNSDQIMIQSPLPPNLDVTADLVLHVRIASGGTTNAVGFTVDSFFNEGDTKVVDTTTTNQTATYAEKIATIAAADIPSGAQTITIGLTPVAHTTDTMNLTAAWLEYTGTTLTS